jgi:DNA topoisomerase-1
MNRAIALLNEPPKGRRAAAPAAPLKELGLHPRDNEPVQLLPGRFGPYVKHGKVNASLPKALSPETITLDQAVQLLADREVKLAEGGGRPMRGARGKPAAAKKTAAKPAAKKAAPKAAKRS